ncbi:MAG: SDR family NAD(P)-dependent oxidoreductase [Gammaproteobacteria bacterium]
MASDPTAKWILITGASSGIGLCAARALRARGYRVIAAARKADDVDGLGAEGFNAVRLDLSDSALIRAAVASVLEQTGGSLYALFNNAGFGQIGPLDGLSRAALRAQFEVNLFGIHELTALILPRMRAQGYGRIIQTSSLLGLIALRYRGAYNASKYALEAWSDTLRLELSGTGIHVVLIEPGPIASRFRENAYAQYRQRIAEETGPQGSNYDAAEDRSRRAAGWFTLPPEAVVKKLIEALETPRPRPRYFVTVPTYVFAFLKRLLPDRALDALLVRL